MTALKVVVFLQLDSAEMIRAWSFAKSSLLTKRSLLQLGDSFDQYILWNVKYWSVRGSKRNHSLNDASGLGVQLHVHLSYSVSAIWQLMTKVSLYNKQEKYWSRNSGLCVTISGGQLWISRRSEAGPCVPGSQWTGSRTAAPPALPQLWALLRNTRAAILLPQPWFSYTRCWVRSVLLVMVVTKAILACCARHRTAQESRKLLSWRT